MPESDSILDSIKKNLGMTAEYTAFDPDILTHINSTFFTLNQLGLGPETVFNIEDKTAKWEDFIGDKPYLVAVKTYMYFKLRLIFDPPATSFAIAAMETQVKELESRLNTQREYDLYIKNLVVNP